MKRITIEPRDAHIMRALAASSEPPVIEKLSDCLRASLGEEAFALPLPIVDDKHIWGWRASCLSAVVTELGRYLGMDDLRLALADFRSTIYLAMNGEESVIGVLEVDIKRLTSTLSAMAGQYNIFNKTSDEVALKATSILKYLLDSMDCFAREVVEHGQGDTLEDSIDKLEMDAHEAGMTPVAYLNMLLEDARREDDQPNDDYGSYDLPW